jgi:hypothetical protein
MRAGPYACRLGRVDLWARGWLAELDAVPGCALAGERRFGFGVELGEPHCGGGAHGRFRNLKPNAANTRTIPTFTISRSQKWCLKNRMSTPTTTTTSVSTYSTTAACLPIVSFY